MTTPFITIRASGPPPEEDVEDGVYPLVLVELRDPRMITTERHPEGTEIIEWVFAIDDAAGDRTVSGATSKATGPRSKAFGWITALLGSVPAMDTQFSKEDLIGRRALGEVAHNASGYPRVNALMAAPKQVKPKPATVVEPAAEIVATPASALRDEETALAAAAKPDDDLGF